MPPAPMNPLQLQVFAGAAAGRRARFDRSPITFGREPDNLLVVEDAHVSRYHGELRFEGGQWLLVNKSSNGTRLNRRNITDKPHAIQSGDEVFVGGKLLFSITLEPVEATPTDEQSIMATDSEAGKPPAKKKQKMYVAIGIYMALLLGLIVFLSTLRSKKAAETLALAELPLAEVEKDVRQPIRKDVQSDSRYRESLAEAERLYHVRDASPSGLFNTMRAYQTAASVSGRDDGRLKDEDAEPMGRFVEVQIQLCKKLHALYTEGITALRRGDDHGAFKAFSEILVRFNDASNPFFQKTEDKRNIATKRLKGKKIKQQK